MTKRKITLTKKMRFCPKKDFNMKVRDSSESDCRNFLLTLVIWTDRESPIKVSVINIMWKLTHGWLMASRFKLTNLKLTKMKMERLTSGTRSKSCG